MTNRKRHRIVFDGSVCELLGDSEERSQLFMFFAFSFLGARLA